MTLETLNDTTTIGIPVAAVMSLIGWLLRDAYKKLSDRVTKLETELGTHSKEDDDKHEAVNVKLATILERVDNILERLPSDKYPTRRR